MNLREARPGGFAPCTPTGPRRPQTPLTGVRTPSGVRTPVNGVCGRRGPVGVQGAKPPGLAYSL
jgi:hypothetical protein